MVLTLNLIIKVYTKQTVILNVVNSNSNQQLKLKNSVKNIWESSHSPHKTAVTKAMHLRDGLLDTGVREGYGFSFPANLFSISITKQESFSFYYVL